MASLQRYSSGGRVYWRLVESRRVNGKPRVFVLRHLGTADALLEKLSMSATRPEGSFIREFGAIAALWEMAQELQVADIIDAQAPKRLQGLSVGQYSLLAALNRCVHPTSKSGLAAWYRGTILGRLLPATDSQLSSQRFWDHMEYLTPEVLGQVEEGLVRRLVEHFGIDLRALLFDATNFDTFIDSATAGELAQRGHAKSKRMDLRIVGLALLVSTDFDVPLLWEIYPGNRPDSVTFAHVIERVVERYRLFAKSCERITLVFDKGNNSEENIKTLDASDYDFVGSLVPSHFPELLDIPLERFASVQDPRLKGLRVYRTTAMVFGKSRPVLLTHSQSLLQGQLRGIQQHLGKRRRKLSRLQQKVYWSYRRRRRGKPYTRESLQKQLDQLTAGQYLHDFLRAHIRSRRSKLAIQFWVDQEAFDTLKRRVLGRRILFARDEQRTNEEFVLAYRAQYHVESAFRQMKEPAFIRFSPIFHWTDSKIHVHAFHCILALILGNLLHRKVVRSGIPISAGKMLKALSEIKEVVTLVPPTQREPSAHPRGRGRPRSVYGLTRMDPLQTRLHEVLHLEAHRAK